jgi:hypothetical protein
MSTEQNKTNARRANIWRYAGCGAGWQLGQ